MVCTFEVWIIERTVKTGIESRYETELRGHVCCNDFSLCVYVCWCRPMVETRWHVGKRLRETWLGRCMEWCHKMKGKGVELLGLQDSEFKETKEGEEDL